MRCYLVGFMGSGKSFWGARLAERLGWPLIDLDAHIEEETGLSIAEIFARSGEAHFRRIEAECLHQTAAMPDVVVATGGGTPCFFDNMAWMNTVGTTIYLNTKPAILAARLWPERTQRPLLQHLREDELLAFIQTKLREREADYRLAQHTLVMDTSADMLESLVRLLRQAS